MSLRFGSWLLLLLPMTGLGALPASSSRVVEADYDAVAGPTNRTYNFCVGAGRANEGLRADWQRQLRQAHADCGFRYIRFHGLFCDDMGVYQEDRRGNPVYNWQYVDELFDFLGSIGMKPFIELSFMPSALASGSSTIFWYHANVTAPKDYARWGALVSAFTRHVTERYGRNEVRTWYFEVWNEPNLTAFWMGGTGGKTYEQFLPTLQAEYFKLYATSARAIKLVDSAYRVGGPATAGSAWINETLERCAAEQLPLDFISTHEYATTSGYLDESGQAGTVFSQDPTAITHSVQATREKMDHSAFASAQLHYTEWSASYTPSDPIHDSYHSAAFILDKIKHIDRTATSMSYWTFTDIFEEAGPRTTPLHGGFGLLNYQDLPKPSYLAYKFLNCLGDKELKNADSASFVCRDRKGGVQALVWDFTITHPGASTIDQEFYLRDQPARPKGEFVLRLHRLPPGKYVVEATRVGYRSNDLQSAYRDLGSPAQLTRSQVARLRDETAAQPGLVETITVGADRSFSQALPLRENDVWFVSVDPR